MNSPIVLPWKHAEWSGIEGLLLPVLVAVMRLCWVWPWMMLIQGFLSPSVDGPVMTPLMLIALPIISFSLARWSMPTLAERRDLRRVTEVRRHIASAGFAVLLFMLWLRFLSQDFALWDLRWLPAAGYELIYWKAAPIEVPGAVLSWSWAFSSGCAARSTGAVSSTTRRSGEHSSGVGLHWRCSPG